MIPYQESDDQRTDSYDEEVKYVQERCLFLSVQSRTWSYKSTSENLTSKGMCYCIEQSQNCLSGDGSIRSICIHNLCIFFEQSAWYCLICEAPMSSNSFLLWQSLITHWKKAWFWGDVIRSHHSHSGSLHSNKD